jgi:Putative GTPase activating protein for Arf
VRSLTLDTLSDSEARLFLALGNETANKIWEEMLPSGEKLEESADREKRMKWIKMKYLAGAYLARSETDGNTVAKNLELYEASKRAELMAVATALAHGADVEWKNEEDGGNTALHACATAQRPSDDVEWYGIECAELLFQNGASMSVLNHMSHNVLDCAVIGNRDREMIEYLAQKFE